MSKPYWRVTAALVLTGMLTSLFPLGADPAHPSWWSQRNVTNSGPVRNKAVANIGQGKHMATQAHAELDSFLSGGAGFTLDSIFPAPPSSPDAAWYAAQKKILNLGQLKALAKPFYDRLNAISPAWVEQQLQANGLTTLGTHYFKDASTGYFYPWNPLTSTSENYRTANLGQLKLVFCLRFSENLDGDGASDLVELQAFGTTAYTVTAAQQQQIQNGTDPSGMDIDGDGLVHSEDAMPGDGDMAWKKSSESNYVLIDLGEMQAGETDYRVNKRGEVMAGGSLSLVLFGGTGAATGARVWNPVDRTWHNAPQHTASITPYLTDIGDDGTVAGFINHCISNPCHRHGYSWQIGGQASNLDGLVPINDAQWNWSSSSAHLVGAGGEIYGLSIKDTNVPQKSALTKWQGGTAQEIEEVTGYVHYLHGVTASGDVLWTYGEDISALSPVKTVLGSETIRSGGLVGVVAQPQVVASAKLPLMARSLVGGWEKEGNLDRAVLWVNRSGTWKKKALFKDLDMGDPLYGHVKGISDDGTVLLGDAVWRNGQSRPLETLVSGGQYENMTSHDMASNGLVVASGKKVKDDNGNAIPPANQKNHVVLLLPVDIVPDYNRDGKINQQDQGNITASNPYRFWVNDDDDYLSDNGGKSTDRPGTSQEGNILKINGLRDLVDFFPLHLQIKTLLDVLPPEDYFYSLESEDGSFTFMETDLVAGNSDHYVKGMLGAANIPDNPNGIVTIAKVSGSLVVKQAKNTQGIGGDLDITFLNAVKSGAKDGLVILESGQSSDKPLKLVVRKRIRTRVGGEKIIEYALPIKTSGVEQMYRHVNIRSAAGGTGGRQTNIAPPVNYPDNMPKLQSNKYFVLLHGYNVNGEQARGWHAEFFKRMWWSGSKARYVGVSWYGEESQTPDGSLTPNFHATVINAFQSSEALKNSLSSLDGEITIAAHSLGNMVVSSAITDHNAPIKHYMLFDAAVAIEAYEGTAAKSNSMVHPEWNLAAYGGPFVEKVWCSEWHKLPWPQGDYRKKLTWRDRLKNRRNVVYHNFYSSGEEVLREHSDPNDTHLFNFVDEQIDDLINGPTETGVYSWAFQEKLKGRTLTGQVLGSRWGGWGFNLTRASSFDPLLGASWLPVDAAALSDADLMSNPYWRRGGEDPGFTEPHPNLFVSGEVGSNYAKDHQHKLLAEGFPARTLPAGANPIPILGNNNYNMMNLKNGWHVGNSNWLHGDIKAVAYTFTWKVYSEFVRLGNLEN